MLIGLYMAGYYAERIIRYERMRKEMNKIDELEKQVEVLIMRVDALFWEEPDKMNITSSSDGSSARYYELPRDAKELQDLISDKNMNAQMGEIGRAWYRYGQCPHSSKERDLKKIIFYAEAELERISEEK